MIRLTEDRRKVGGISLGAIYIGDSEDEANKHFCPDDVGGILCVAQDMTLTHKWQHGVETMHVGLVDGPGNEQCAYVAAVLALHALLRRHNVLVCCHTGTRALTVAVMYMSVYSKIGWFRTIEMLQERVDESLPLPRAEHMDAFDRMDWSSLKVLMGV